MKRKQNLSQETFDYFPALKEWPSGYRKDFDRIAEFANRIKGFDTETKGLSPFRSDVMILSVGLCDEPKFAGSTYCRNGWNEKDFIKLKEVLENPNNILVGHNIKYDVNWIAVKTGIQVRAMLFDTMFAQYLLDENLKPNDLDSAIKRASWEAHTQNRDEEWIDLRQYKEEVDRENLDAQHKDDLLLYQNQDADASRRLYNYFVPKLKEGGYDKLMATASMVLPILSKMETRGVYLDKEWSYKTQSKLFSELVQLRYKMCDIAKTSFNPDSPQSLSSILYRKLQFTPTNFTSSGQPSTASETLGYLVDQATTEDQNNFLDSIVSYKKQMKLLTTYYQPIERWTRYDGRVHATYSLGRFENEEGSGGTVTGRLTCKEPNLQQIPRGKEHRGMFRATEGFTLLDGDFCVSPTTKILTANLEWKNAENLKEKEELIGFDEFSSLNNPRCFRTTNIIKLTKKTLNSIKIVTDKGDIEVSENHSFLVKRRNKKGGAPTLYWIFAKDILNGDEIGFTEKPWELDTTYEGGYIAGFLDGEGWISDGVLGFAQTDNIARITTLNYLEMKGYVFKETNIRPNQYYKNSKLLFQYKICNRMHIWKLLGTIRPKRLLEKRKDIWENKRVWSNKQSNAKVLSLEYLGQRENVCFSTTTRTFIANGFLSHNSQLELRVAAFLSQDPRMMEAFLNGLDIHTAVMSELTGIPYDEIEARRSTDEKIKISRVAFKEVNFGIFYLMSAKRLQRSLRTKSGIHKTLDECKEYIAQWFAKFSKAKEWLDATKLQAVGYGWVKMPLGQVRRLPEASFDYTKEAAHALSQACNFPVQSLASWICLIGLIILDNYFESHKQWFEGHIIMQVHDSVTAEIKLINRPYNLMDLETIKIEAKAIMEHETIRYLKEVFGIIFNVPLVFDIELKERWS